LRIAREAQRREGIQVMVRMTRGLALRVGISLAVLAAVAGVLSLTGVTAGLSEQPEWPLKTVPRSPVEDGGARLAAATSEEAASAAISAASAEKLVLERDPGASLRETRLVRVSSVGPRNVSGANRGGDSRLVWAVSIMPEGGPVCRGCAASARDAAMQTVLGRGPETFESHPPTAEEWEAISAEASRMTVEFLATLTDPYVVEFVDANTGEVAFGYSGWGGKR